MIKGSSSGKSGSSGKAAPPPEFSHYEAEYSLDANLDVVSYDPHLNMDGSFFKFSFFNTRIWHAANKSIFIPLGEALCRFLLSHAAESPIVRISCRGSHVEKRRKPQLISDKNYTQTVTIIDFDFCIDIQSKVPVVQWSVPDNEPAYRGRMVREVEGPKRRGRQAAETRSSKYWEKGYGGLPHWVSWKFADGSGGQLDGLMSSKTLRQWADEYCASPKKMKEFVYKKVSFPYIYFVILLNLWTPIGPLWLGYATVRRCNPIHDKKIVSI